MAVALKSMFFTNPLELTKFTADAANKVGTIVSLVYDTASGKYVLFWTET